MPNNGDRIADVMRKELARARPMIPKEYKMPDLSELDELTMSLIHLVFGPGDRNASRGTALNLRIYLRLVDKAVDEYESARRQIVAQLAEKERSPEEMAEDGRIIYMFKFVDHMENCILTVRRIIRCLDRLKRNQDGLQFPRLVRKHIEALSNSVVDMRNVVEHMDQVIQDDKIKEGDSIMLRLTESDDGVMIAGESLKFDHLSTLIRQLHVLGKYISEWIADGGQRASEPA